MGVQYVHNGKLKYVRAKKEVILSGGAIGSPQMLMLSGIGPREHLEDMKVRTWVMYVTIRNMFW